MLQLNFMEVLFLHSPVPMVNSSHLNNMEDEKNRAFLYRVMQEIQSCREDKQVSIRILCLKKSAFMFPDPVIKPEL